MQEFNFLLFGDNGWEAKSVMESIKKYSAEFFDKISLTGSPAMPIYLLETGENKIVIECRGNYSNWEDLPQKVDEYVNFFDKPDVIFYNLHEQKIICAAEFTETVCVGNSPWQRSGRVVSSTILNIPFLAVYPCGGEDRSLTSLRESTALLSELFLKLSKDAPEHPTLLLLKGGPHLVSLNKQRISNGLSPLNKNGENNKLISDWFALRILLQVNSSESKNLETIENKIYSRMFDTLFEECKKGNTKLTRVDKDIPLWNSKLNNPKNIKQLKKHSLIELSAIEWKGKTGKVATSSYFNRVFVNEVKNSLGSIFKTYVNGGAHCIIPKEYVKQVEKIILKSYPPSTEFNWKEGTLNSNYPLVLISLLGWQRGGKSLSDPNTGEAIAFPALFDSFEEKKANIIYFIYGIPHKNWLNQLKGLKNNMLLKTVKKMGDLLCIDINNGGDKRPISIKLK